MRWEHVQRVLWKSGSQKDRTESLAMTNERCFTLPILFSTSERGVLQNICQHEELEALFSPVPGSALLPLPLYCQGQIESKDTISQDMVRQINKLSFFPEGEVLLHTPIIPVPHFTCCPTAYPVPACCRLFCELIYLTKVEEEHKPSKILDVFLPF